MSTIINQHTKGYQTMPVYRYEVFMDITNKETNQLSVKSYIVRATNATSAKEIAYQRLSGKHPHLEFYIWDVLDHDLIDVNG